MELTKTVPGPIAQRPVVKEWLLGVVLSVVLALVAAQLSRLPAFSAHGIGLLTVAIVLGIGLANLLPTWTAADNLGVTFTRQKLLRLGVLLYGFRLTFSDVAVVGMSGILIDATMVASTFLLAWAAGTRWLGMERDTALLVGAGSAICGAAAVMATAPVLRARDDQVAVAVTMVVIFGTVSMLLYPFSYGWLVAHSLLAASPTSYGRFAGSTIHEVAQVVAAGRAVGDAAADIAVVTKMVRVMMLAPFLLLLSAWLSRSRRQDAALKDKALALSGVVIPWFAVGFIAVAGVNSVIPLSPALAAQVAGIDDFILAMAMAALGLSTQLSALRRAGTRPLLLGGLLFTWLALGGIMVNIGAWFLAAR